MKKIILSGLFLLILNVGCAKPTSVKSLFAFPITKIATTIKYATLTGYETAKTTSNLVVHTCSLTKDLITGIQSIATNTISTGREASQIALYIAAITAVLYGIDYAFEYATKLGLPSSLFSTYEFGTICKKVKALIASKPIIKTKKVIKNIQKQLVHLYTLAFS